MGHFIHRCDTPEGPRYRVWSTIVDAYLCDPMPRAQMAAWLLHDENTPAQAEERLQRTDRQGTSALGRTRETTAWETERCDGCGRFHHDYDPRDDGTCAYCGEGADEVGHRPPCEEQPRG